MKRFQAFRAIRRIFSYLPGLLIVLFLTGCSNLPIFSLRPANVTVTFDLGGGGSGFAASIYAQEIHSGKTFKGFYPAGSHGIVVMPTSPPVVLQLDAPGTYIFYATLIEAPEDYHYGATGCPAGQDCQSHDLLALDVKPGGNYQITISDRSAVLPVPGQPVNVPWKR